MVVEKLDHLALVKITGDDASSFLQGQLTNDIELASKQWQYSGYCTPKGRLLALFTIWRTNDEIFALIDKSLVEGTLKRLRMYVMRSKVTIEIAADNQQYAIFEPSQSELVTNDFLDKEIIPINKYDFVTQASTHCLCFGDRLLISTKNSINSDNINQDNPQQWLQEDINTGLPQINSQNTELFIPQMLNLDVLNGISFKKGCYTGQEIVARMHYLGKLKQRMFVCTLSSSNNDKETNEHVKSGDKIYSDAFMKSSAGSIVNVNADSVLAVLRLDSIKEVAEHNGFFRLNENTTLQVNENQPYSIDTK